MTQSEFKQSFKEHNQKLRLRKDLKVQKLCLWFDNLYENKVIYHNEEEIELAIVSDFNIQEFDFSVNLTKPHFITPNVLKEKQRVLKGENIKHITFPLIVFTEDKHQTIQLPIRWRTSHLRNSKRRIYTEPSFVKYIEKLVEYGDIEDALNLING